MLGIFKIFVRLIANVPLSKEEKLRRKREAEKRRYDRLKENPEGKEKLRRKEREKYLKKKANKTIRPINEISKTEQRTKRKQWRKYSQAYRIKKKRLEKDDRIIEEKLCSVLPDFITPSVISIDDIKLEY